jgi:hypothetical protein
LWSPMPLLSQSDGRELSSQLHLLVLCSISMRALWWNYRDPLKGSESLWTISPGCLHWKLRNSQIPFWETVKKFLWQMPINTPTSTLSTFWWSLSLSFTAVDVLRTWLSKLVSRTSSIQRARLSANCRRGNSCFQSNLLLPHRRAMPTKRMSAITLRCRPTHQPRPLSTFDDLSVCLSLLSPVDVLRTWVSVNWKDFVLIPEHVFLQFLHFDGSLESHTILCELMLEALQSRDKHRL